MRKISKIVKNPNFIPGIYNYCDSWCERCAYTSRCANFISGEERYSDMKDLDIRNEQFWKKLGDIFKNTFELIYEKAEEYGIDLDNLDDEIDLPSMHNSDNQFLIKLCKKYEELTKSWFEEQHFGDLETVEKIEQKKTELENVIEVIYWYQYQIEVKFRRSFQGIDDNDFTSKHDMKGSAKVALIGIDRSLAAWNLLMHLIPLHEKEILQIISILKKMKNVGERQFPNARSFVRPGFDE
ncbi:MAG: hypothetical protein K9N09_11820 [Candidatus Cloacimonetes bacterium]|nr:hypothetical protein [Candidatus Cloacimonadota bacterium]MCF7815170.1 hypothetical protein [Candidatus Cloacimonadota bacterium]MCF7869372.1 hypothetical protein [Candidatus Cloacimonadota bacterium]MCF7884774.1 hypothetical protein [Candidatus Cloacimonadota bacterium]